MEPQIASYRSSRLGFLVEANQSSLSSGRMSLDILRRRGFSKLIAEEDAAGNPFESLWGDIGSPFILSAKVMNNLGDLLKCCILYR